MYFKEGGFGRNARFLAAASLLVIGVLLDFSMVAVLSPKGDAGLYIGFGLLGLLSWLLIMVGILAMPYYSVSAKSNRMTLTVMAILGAVFLTFAAWLFIPRNGNHGNNGNSLEVQFDTIPGQIIGGGESEFGLPGQCVVLAGPDQHHPSISPAKCDSVDSNYRIIKIAKTRNECPTDSDQRFSHWTPGKEQTLCLDYNWSTNKCFKIGRDTWYALVESCGSPESERAQSVVLDSSTVRDCPAGGFAHPERRFTICTQRS
ncbi:hypothetical protein HBE99_07950 [Mycobacteroides chelonae]|uniref:LppU/SCO3897 family protein n=1 Tax=Mycobacteroides chelonae TaxID=1774 RepID=UPI001910B701|nr:hypothetical protein [Mycobacteroides chelonae]QQG96782.1 hypothetical protein HBE99_07950 [Mycobacteroides chelonae]